MPAVFPHAAHGIYEFVEKPDGTRDDTRHAAGCFETMLDCILHGRLP